MLHSIKGVRPLVMNHIGFTPGRLLLMLILFAFMRPLRAGNPITIVNDNTGTILVTITNMNANPPVTISSALPINGFAAISIDAPTDVSGNAHLGWSTSNTDHFEHRCGSGSGIVKPGGSLHVRADKECHPQGAE